MGFSSPSNASAPRVTLGEHTSSPFSSSSSTAHPSRPHTITTSHSPSTALGILRRRRRRRGRRHSHSNTISPPTTSVVEERDRARATYPAPTRPGAETEVDPAVPILSSCIPQSTAHQRCFSHSSPPTDDNSDPDMPRKHRPSRPRFWLAGPEEDIESVYPAPGGFVGAECEFLRDPRHALPHSGALRTSRYVPKHYSSAEASERAFSRTIG